MLSFIKLIKINLIVLIAIALVFYVTILLGDGPGKLDTYLKFMMGAKILLLLTFGFAAVPGIIIAFAFIATNYSPLIVDNFGVVIFTLIHTIVPISAIHLMNITKVSNFIDLTNIDFRHIMFLVLFASLFSSIFKYILIEEFTNLEINGGFFIWKYFISNSLGGLVLIYFVLRTIPYALSKLGYQLNN